MKSDIQFLTIIISVFSIGKLFFEYGSFLNQNKILRFEDLVLFQKVFH